MIDRIFLQPASRHVAAAPRLVPAGDSVMALGSLDRLAPEPQQCPAVAFKGWLEQCQSQHHFAFAQRVLSGGLARQPTATSSQKVKLLFKGVVGHDGCCYARCLQRLWPFELELDRLHINIDLLSSSFSAGSRE
jgi:hypothetical protein